MFSWSKKKDKKRGRSDRESEENEFGIKLDKGPDDKQLEAELKSLAGVDNLPEDDLNGEEGEDIETELLRLIGGEKGKKVKKKQLNADESMENLDELTAEIDLGEEDVEVDENDPELLQELLELTNSDTEIQDDEPASASESEEKPTNGEPDIMSTLKERLKMYKTAEAKAKENNENSRARRFTRGIKTLEDMIKKAKSGKSVSPADIPPAIALNLKPAPPPQMEISENNGGNGSEAMEGSEEIPQADLTANGQNVGTHSQSDDILTILEDRLKLYKTAESKAKESSETTRARRFNRGVKSLEELIKQAKAGKAIAPENIPPVVALNLKPAPPVASQPPSDENDLDGHEESLENEMGSITFSSQSDDAESKESQEPERNILDVLSERLQMYTAAEAKAKESGEISRARRFTRGIKTLHDLIRLATAGKPIAPDDIPPMVAVNLKPVPPVALNEEEPEEADVVRDNLVRSSDESEKALSFMPVEDIDLEAELEEEKEEAPLTVLEGLEQRAKFYTKLKERAKEEGNSTLFDQNERIVKIYLNAIKTFKSGGFIDVEKLPNPKGCPPIPIPFFVPEN